MSTTISAVVINFLAVLLPLFGIQLENEALMTTIQTVIAIATGLWIWKERVAKGDISIFGTRK